jgi:cytoskeletal protein RodZ
MVGRFTETLGQYLRRERESRTMSLEELSRATRIGLPFLEALERDDFDFFSQRDFIHGFLQGYARHLGLNVQEVLGRYRVQSELMSRKETFQQIPLFPGAVGPKGEAEGHRPEPPAAVPPGRTRRWSFRTLLQIIIVALALGLSWYIHQLLKNAEKTEKSGTDPAASTSAAKPGSEPGRASPGVEGAGGGVVRGTKK